jgi:hypothetical protein
LARALSGPRCLRVKEGIWSSGSSRRFPRTTDEPLQKRISRKTPTTSATERCMLVVDVSKRSPPEGASTSIPLTVARGGRDSFAKPNGAPPPRRFRVERAFRFIEKAAWSRIRKRQASTTACSSDGDRPVMNEIDDDRDELAFAKLDLARYLNMPCSWSRPCAEAVRDGPTRSRPASTRWCTVRSARHRGRW